MLSRFIRPALLQPMSWLLLLLSLVALVLKFTLSPSDSPLGVVLDLSLNFSSLFVAASMICTAYAPQTRHQSSPKLKRVLWWIVAFAVFCVLAATYLQVRSYKQKRTNEVVMLELERDLNKLELELKQLPHNSVSTQQ